MNSEHERSQVLHEADPRLRIMQDLTPSLLVARTEDSGEAFHYLPYIDPYGDTIFNSLQAEPVLAELARLRNLELDSKEAELLDGVEDSVDECRDSNGLYVRFVGDCEQTAPVRATSDCQRTTGPLNWATVILVGLACGMLILMPSGAKRRSRDLRGPATLAMRLAAITLGYWTAATAVGDLREQELTASARDLVALQRVVELYPMNYSAHVRIAEVWARAGKCSEAMPHIEFARTLYPSSAPARALSQQCGQARATSQKRAKL